MEEKEKHLPDPREKQRPVIEPEIVDLKHEYPEEEPPEFIVYRSNVMRTSIVPGIFGAAIGIALGAIMGFMLGLMGGPPGLLLGIFLGAFAGAIGGFLLGSMAWLFLPPYVRLMIFLFSTFAIVNWISVQWFHFSLLQKILDYF